MSNWLTFALVFCLFADADLPRVSSFHPRPKAVETIPPGEEIPVLPSLVSAVDGPGSSAQGEADSRPKKATLQEQSKLELIRYVSGEFAHAIKSLPAGKEGFIVDVGKPVNQGALESAVATHGAAVNSGDSVQITNLTFHDNSIVVDVNGGGRGKHHWRDHLQLSMGGLPTGTVRNEQQQTGPAGIQPGMGSTIFLDFSKHVPDLTPEDLKQILAPFLDFSKQRSAAVFWVDTLPPEMKAAIKDRKAVVGMDRDMVVAAIGKPDHKVRERDSQGDDTEDWIYGQPPSKTVFVHFTGNLVTKIESFPR
jgi:hypothetical protein